MSCALVIIRVLWLSSVVDALWNKSMGELYVCQDRRGRVSVCVCVHSLQHWLLLQHCGSPLFISAGLCD